MTILKDGHAFILSSEKKSNDDDDDDDDENGFHLCYVSQKG